LVEFEEPPVPMTTTATIRTTAANPSTTKR
jgi:hypothetical protein